MLRTRLAFVLSVTSALAVVRPAPAQSSYTIWTGGATNGDGTANNNWSAAANWGGVTIPNNGTADLEFTSTAFGGTQYLSPNVDQNYTVDSIQFAGTSSFTIGATNGRTLSVGKNGITVSSLVNQTISAPIMLTGNNQVWAFTSTGNLTASAGINTNNWAMILTPTGTNTLNGAITGTGSIITGVGGTMILTSTGNTFSGGTLIGVGNTLEITGTLPGSVSIGTGGTLLFAQTGGATLSGAYSGSGSLAVAGPSASTTYILTNSSNSYSGPTLVQSGILQLGGLDVIPDTSPVTLGSGTNASILRMAGFSDAIGGLASSGTGTNQVTNGGGTGLSTLAINQTANSTFAGVLGGTGTNENNFALIKFGNGKLVLSGTNTFTGGTTISGGILSITGDANLGAPSGGLILNGGTLQITGAGNSTVLVAARSISLGVSGGTIDTSSLGMGGGNILAIASPISGSGPLTLVAHGNTSDTGNNSSSRLVLSGANTMSGSVSITAGLVDASSNFGNSLNALTIYAGAGIVATGSSETDVGKSLTLAGNGDSIFRAFGPATLGLDGVIGGPGNLRKTDLGTLLLNTPNSYGNTIVADGTLKLGVAGALPNGQNVKVNDNSSLILNGTNQTIGSLTVGSTGSSFATITTGIGLLTLGGDITVNSNAGGHGASIVGNIDLGGASRTVNIVNSQGSQAYDITIGGPISGAGGLTLNGAAVGRFALYGSTSTYTGPTTVLAGTLFFGATNVLPSTTDLVVAANATASLYAPFNGLGVSIGNYNQSVNSLAGAGNVNIGTATLTISGSNSTTFSGAISGNSGGVTKSGTGTLTLSGSNSYYGMTTVSGGTLVVAASGSLSNSWILAGPGAAVTINGSITPGNGKFFQLDGTIANPAVATLNDGGALVTPETDVGNSANGVGNFIQPGGSHTLAGGLYLGVNFGSVGTYSLAAGMLTTSVRTAVGYRGVGTFLQTGGTDFTATLSVGANAGSTGAYTLSSGSLNTVTSIVGDSGAGTFTQTGGSQVLSTSGTLAGVFLGQSAGSTGQYTLSGGTLSSLSTTIGVAGNGTFVQTGGTHTVSTDLVLGDQLGGVGAYTLTNGSLSSSFTIVAAWGAGTFTQNGGTHTIGSNLAVGDGSGGQGTYYLNGGSLTDSQAFIGSSGVGAFIQNGGIHVVINTLTLANTGGNGAYSLNGGLLTASGVAGGTGTSTFNFNGGTLRSTATNSSFVSNLTTASVQIGGAVIDNGGYAIGVPQPLLHDSSLGSVPDGGLTIRGTGTVALSGANTYTGGTTVAGGTLFVTSDANLGWSLGSVTLLNGSQLQFAASVTTSRTFNLNSSALAPVAGTSITYYGATVNGGYLRGPGTQIVTGGTAFSGTSTFNSTVINVTGAASFADFTNGGALNLSAGLTAPVVMNGFTNQGSGAITIGAGSQINASDFETYGTLTVSTGTMTTPTALTNLGTTPLYFNGGSRTFIGTPATAGTFTAGIDLHGQNAVVAGGLFVNNGYVVDSTNGGATVVADYGALVKGAGFFQNSPVTQNGGRVQAGNSPGSASFGQLTFGPGGVSNYVFAIDDATGMAGPHPDAAGLVSGWGLMKSVRQSVGTETTSGDFAWTANAADKLTFAIDTLVNPTMVGTDIAGPMANFDPTRSYSWPAVQWTGAYSGPTDAATLNAATIFNMSGFENPITGTFGWNLDSTSQQLDLVYSPSAVPEPGSLSLVSVLAIGWVAYWRRRWQSNESVATRSA